MSHATRRSFHESRYSSHVKNYFYFRTAFWQVIFHVTPTVATTVIFTRHNANVSILVTEEV